MGRNKSYSIFVLAFVLLSFMAISTSAQLTGGAIQIKPIIIDSDNDGVTNTIDNCPTTYNPGQSDSDGDGIGDECDNCPDNSNADQADSDEDGIGNVCERKIIALPVKTVIPLKDADGDKISDSIDNCLKTYNPDQADTDGDGVGDECDNCPDNPNADQADSDEDGIGDVCERKIIALPTKTVIPLKDADGDKISDSIDNCPEIHNPDQADTDGDGVGDECQYEVSARMFSTQPSNGQQIGFPDTAKTPLNETPKDVEVDAGFNRNEGLVELSKQDLGNRVSALVAPDEDIEKVTIDNEIVTIDYRQPAKLFGLIDIDYTLSTKVNVYSGKVKMKKPWWTIFASGDVDTDDYEEELANSIAAQGDMNLLLMDDMQQSQNEQAQSTQTSDNISKMMHDDLKAIINNSR